MLTSRSLAKDKHSSISHPMITSALHMLGTLGQLGLYCASGKTGTLMLMYPRLKNCLDHRERQPSEIDVFVTDVLEEVVFLVIITCTRRRLSMYFYAASTSNAAFFSMDSDSVLDVVSPTHGSGTGRREKTAFR